MQIQVILHDISQDAVDAWWFHYFSKPHLKRNDIQIKFIFLKLPEKNTIDTLQDIDYQVIPKNALLPLIFRTKINKLIRKKEADFIFSTDISIGIFKKVKQVFFISNDIFIRNTRHKNTLSAAFKIITAGDTLTTQIKKLIGVDSEKISTLSMLPKAEVKMSYAERHDFYEKKTEGQPYYLYLSTHRHIDSYILILKAFSAFKKWNRSGMKMIMAANQKTKIALSEKISQYKYRNDVLLIESASLASFIPYAMGCVMMPSKNQVEKLCIESLQKQVPLIIKDTEYNRSLLGKIVLYAEQDEKNVGKQLILLYKDESIQEELAYQLHLANQRPDSWPFDI